MPGAAKACQQSLPRRNPVFDRLAQENHMKLVEKFFENIEGAGSFEQIERLTESMLRPGFRWPSPQPAKLLEATPLGLLVFVRALGILETPENDCNSSILVHTYYSFHFDQDQIALLNTISHG